MSNVVRPIGAYALSGLTFAELNGADSFLTLDTVKGYLLKIQARNDDTTILNSCQVDDFQGATGLAIQGDKLWITRHNQVWQGQLSTLNQTPMTLLLTLPYPAEGIAVWQQTLYVSAQQSGYIWVYDLATLSHITQFALPGIGIANLTVWGDYLWLCDRTEQTIYCLDRATGEAVLNFLTPFPHPTGIAVPPETSLAGGTLWLTYALEEPYIRDNPNTPEFPYQLTFRDRTFIHPLTFAKHPQENAILSTGYRLEMIYAEELEPLDQVQLQQLEWQIALPASTPRQTVITITPIGLPFTTTEVNGQTIARFKFDTLAPNERHLFGWRAIIDVRAIKYQITPRTVEKCPALPLNLRQRYLVDDDDLSMSHPSVKAAAREAIGNETNILRQVLSIRNYVYDKLSYGIRPAIDTPDIVLARGVGSCGEYVGLLLALCRLNGIACRTVGRYKCPPHPEQMHQPLEPDFNHVWIEFFVPGLGWLPMESNVDDIQEGGPYPLRFFMGLPWFHIEMAKETPFERLQTHLGDPEVKLGDMALNHVRFQILAELQAVP
jgi:transglutaminase-like putative cysteine protease